MKTEKRERINKIVQNFEDGYCIFGCNMKVKKISDITSYISYKCPKCKSEYTAKSVLEAITIISDKNGIIHIR